jgi:plastocyanin
MVLTPSARRTPVVPFTLHLQSIITMFPSTFLALSTLAGLAAAASHTVVVGGAAGLVFTPSNISAAIGDTVTFVFQASPPLS